MNLLLLSQFRCKDYKYRFLNLNHHFLDIISFEFTPYRLNHVLFSFHPRGAPKSEESRKRRRAGVFFFAKIPSNTSFRFLTHPTL
jgi:hypothetical protein